MKNSKQEADEDENECNDITTNTEKQKMNFPPTKITTAHLIKQNSNGLNQNNNNNHNNDEDEANCGFCLDSVHAQNPFGIDATTPQQSPLKNYNHTPFLSPMHRENSDGSGQFKLFPHANNIECTPSPPPTEYVEDDLHNNSRDIIINNNQEIKWYDNDDTVCFVLCGHFFHVMCLMRCEQNSCPICRHYLFPESTSICNSCNLCTKDLWVCLTCGHVGCGRFSKEKCALKHYQSTSHIWAKCITTSHVWDYADDDYVYRIVMAEVQSSGQTKLVSVQGQNDDGIDGSTKHLPQELDHFSSIKQEEFIYEYNFIVQDKLKRLQIFHESKMKRIKKNGENELNKLDDEITRIQKEIQSKNKNNAKLLAKYTKDDDDETKVEFVDDIEYLRKQLEEERNRGDKLKKMIHNVFVEQKTFNEKLKEYENTLKQSLSMTESTLNMEINNLQNDLRDYKAHLDTSNKMKKMVDTTDELNGAQVSVRPGKSKNNQKRQGKNKPHSNKKSKKSRKNRK